MTKVTIETDSEVNKKTYKAGDFFKDVNDLHVLAQVDTLKFAFVGVKSGNRYNDPISVSDPLNITEREISIMLMGKHFTPVKSTKITYEI